jgi:hypothetical protein
MNYDEYEGRPDLAKKRDRAVTWVRALVIITCAYMIVVLSAVFANTLLSFSSRRTLLDCTQPTGHCYQEGQKRSAEIIAHVLQDLHLALVCQDHPGHQTDEQITRCVRRLLEKEGR